MSERLEQVLADEAEDAQVLRRKGHVREAELIEAVIRRVRESDAADLLVFMSEADAVLRSGHSRAWFRSRFAAWETQGRARYSPRGKRERQYQRIIVPIRSNPDAIRADAIRAAREDAA